MLGAGCPFLVVFDVEFVLGGERCDYFLDDYQ
jgi:hypothetical protein